MRTIDLPCYGIQIVCDSDGVPYGINSGLRQYLEVVTGTDATLESAIDTLEAIVLAHAIRGVNVLNPDYVSGLQMWVEKMASCIH